MNDRDGDITIWYSELWGVRIVETHDGEPEWFRILDAKGNIVGEFKRETAYELIVALAESLKER